MKRDIPADGIRREAVPSLPQILLFQSVRLTGHHAPARAH